jgi:hypothetical protein
LGDVLNIKSLNHYWGRYSRKSIKKTPEKTIGWDLYDILMERLPVLVLRKRNLKDDDKNWPLSWERDRPFQLAIDLTLNMLKGWQAYRPDNSKKIVKRLKKDLPEILLTFQKYMLNKNARTPSEIIRKSKSEIQEIIITVSKVVGEISSYKNIRNPMMGSKILNCFFPELFPVWDTKWIKNAALRKEKLSPDFFEKWLPTKTRRMLNKRNQAAMEYAVYFALMLKEIYGTSDREYRNIEKAFILHSEIDEEIVYEFYAEITPFLFEICLLGKHRQHIHKSI